MQTNADMVVEKPRPSGTPEITSRQLVELRLLSPKRHINAQRVISSMRRAGHRFADGAVRRDLKALAGAGLVEEVGRGNRRRYRLAEQGAAALAQAGRYAGPGSPGDCVPTSAPRDEGASCHAPGPLKARLLPEFYKRFQVGPFNCTKCGYEFSISTRYTSCHPPFVSCPYCQQRLELPLEDVATPSVSQEGSGNGGAPAMRVAASPKVPAVPATNPSAS